MMVGLAQACELTGKHASTITRAIQAGKLSATQGSDGNRQFDVAELQRWNGGKLNTPGAGEKEDAIALANGSAIASAIDRNALQMAELAAKEAEIAGLRELLCAREEMLEETRRERDRWQEQASQITRLLTDQRSEVEREREKREAAEHAVQVERGRGWLVRLLNR